MATDLMPMSLTLPFICLQFNKNVFIVYNKYNFSGKIPVQSELLRYENRTTAHLQDYFIASIVDFEQIFTVKESKLWSFLKANSYKMSKQRQ